MYRCRSPGGNIWDWPIQMETSGGSSSLKKQSKSTFFMAYAMNTKQTIIGSAFSVSINL
mgnify:CR=1 FL=1